MELQIEVFAVAQWWIQKTAWHFLPCVFTTRMVRYVSICDSYFFRSFTLTRSSIYNNFMLIRQSTSNYTNWIQSLCHKRVISAIAVSHVIHQDYRCITIYSPECGQNYVQATLREGHITCRQYYIKRKHSYYAECVAILLLCMHPKSHTRNKRRSHTFLADFVENAIAQVRGIDVLRRKLVSTEQWWRYLWRKK